MPAPPSSEPAPTAAPSPAPADAERQRAEQAEARVAELGGRLADANRMHLAARHELEARVHQLEREVEEQRRENQRVLGRAATDGAAYDAKIAALREQLAELESVTIRAVEPAPAPGGGRRDESGRLELNTATVEELRGLGLSITQAARVVARREGRGGFTSIEDLDEIPGFPQNQRDELKNSAYVDPDQGRGARP